MNDEPSLNLDPSPSDAAQTRPTQQQSLGDVQLQGDDNIFNVVQGNIVTLTQNKIIQISVDEIKTREFIITSPYKGLRSFESKDKDDFFGRDQFIKSLVNELEHTNFVLLLGASGSGKSSVVRAGLIPWLRQKWGTQWVNLTLTPDQDPFESLYGSLLSYFKQSEAQVVRASEGDSLSQLVTTLKAPEAYWFIFIDQFEELFTTSDAQKRDRFISSLAHLCKEHEGTRTLKIVATMRADFLDRLDAHPANLLVQATKGHRPLMTQLHPDELRLAIEQPAAHHGVVFETGLVEEIIKDVQGQAGYLPLLQYTLNMLWETEVSDGGIHDRTLNIGSYRNIGGVRGALQQRVDEIYQGLSPSGQLAAQRIFLKLVGIGGDTASETDWRPVRKREARSRFSDPLEQTVLTELIDANLLVSDGVVADESTGATVEIAHEVLLTSWPQLQDWIRENREAIALRNRLNDDVTQWKQEKPEDELWSGVKLAKAVALKDDDTFNQVLGGFGPEVNAFITASVERRDRLEKEKEAQRQRELEQERKARKTAQRVTLGALIGGVAMTGLAVFSGLQMRQAEIQQIRTSLALSKTAISSNQTLDADIASIRAARILRKSFWQVLMPDDKLRNSVLAQLQQTTVTGREQNRLEGHQGQIWDIEFSPDGTQIATGGEDGTVRLWDAAGKPIAAFKGHQGRVFEIKFSPDGTQIKTDGEDGTARLWDKSGNQLAVFHSKIPQGQVIEIEFSPDGTQIATGEADGTVRLGDTAGNQLAVFEGHQGPISDIEFSPDSTQIATLGHDGTLHLWDTAENQLAVFEGHQGSISDIEFSPDGTQIATSGTDRIARLWDTAGNQLAVFESPQESIFATSFNPDGTLLLTSGNDGTVRLWDKSGNQLAVFEGHQGRIYDIQFSSDGTQMATHGEDGTARLWDILWDKSGNQPAVFESPQGPIMDIEFSPDGTQIATSGADGIARLWDTAGTAGNQRVIFEGPQEWIGDIQFSPGGTLLVTESSSGETIRLRDITGNQLAIFENPQVLNWHIAFSSDGTQMATEGGDGSIRLWDMAGNQLAVFEVPQGSIRGITFSPDGILQIATAGEDGSIRLWDIAGNQLAVFEVPQGSIIRDITFSPDGILQIATSGVDGNARLWDTAGNQLAVFESPQGLIIDIMFSPDGTQIATLGDGDAAYLWDTSGNQLAVFQGYHGSILLSSTAFSPDGTKFSTIGSDSLISHGIVYLWDTAGNQLAVFKSPTGPISDIAFSPDSTQIATLGDDGTAQLWSVGNIDELLSRQCDWLRDYLTNNVNVDESDRKLCDGISH